MNLFDRFTRVAKSNLNNVLKNLEDPEKIMTQAVEDMQKDLVKVRQSYAEVTAIQRRLLKQKEQCDAVADDWYKRAQLALQAGNECLAKSSSTAALAAGLLEEEEEEEEDSDVLLSLEGFNRPFSLANSLSTLLAASNALNCASKLAPSVPGKYLPPALPISAETSAAASKASTFSSIRLNASILVEPVKPDNMSLTFCVL
jgi:hypothetical protein